MIGVVLSHLRGKNHAFSTELLIKFGRKLTQIRLRRYPNDPTTLESFGHRAEYVLAGWWPGARVEFDGYGDVPPMHRRPTHPEDAVILDSSHYNLLASPLPPREFLEMVRPLTFGGIKELFPQLLMSPGSHSAFVPAGTEVARSAGYVRCRTLHVAEIDKMLVRDEAGEMCLLHIRDQFLLQAIKGGELAVGQKFENLTARFVLADPFQADGMTDERCYMVLAHVVF